MKKQSIFKFIISTILVVFAIVVAFDLAAPARVKLNKILAKSAIKTIEQENIAYDAKSNAELMAKTVKFDKEGMDNIALVSMIKDEDDIIYENLVWHFAVGFRKFVIVDNNSSDKTRFLVEKFRDQTLGKAIVIIVDDPIVEYIQSEVTTGAMRLANSVWPKVEWVFPVDADEFWYPTTDLKNILSHIPENKDIILTHQYNHFPIKNAQDSNFSQPFYDVLDFRLKTLSPGFGKVAVRSKPDITIAQGNHSARAINYYRNADYVAGNALGLDMRHFQMRSVFQVEKKYSNGAKANILGQKLGILSQAHGAHWTAFKKEVDEKGLKQAAIDRFNGHVRPANDCAYDPLPMREAFEAFEELILK